MVVSNALGMITGLVANVSVVQPPAIQQQPESQIVFAGTNVAFSVVASGKPDPGYQWQFNSVNIAGAANSSYAIPYVVITNAGSYRVVVTNSAGALTSAVAVLMVNTPSWPVLASWPADQAGLLADTKTLAPARAPASAAFFSSPCTQAIYP